METPLFLFQLIVLVFSIVLHEVSHGFIAERLGDPTARLMGRLTLNPLKHLDPFGSVILPLLLSLIPGGVIFGWAKPVPYDPRNLRHPERDGALIAVAGPISNFALALVFGLVIRVLGLFQLSGPFIFFGELLAIVVLINLALAVFNLIPIPPLDGSKVLFAFLPSQSVWRAMLSRYGFIILLAFIMFGVPFIGPVVFALFRFLIGE
ncbi:MAG: site-2 protease family protein [Patescibacteria group bacterium]